MDEGFHNVLSAICSAKLWILWCLNKLCAVQSVMISFTGGQFRGGYYRKCGRWMKGFTMC